jgi:HK97 family phage prohead protease
MPYSISTEAEDCNGFAVVKDDDNFIMGCHETEEKAKNQITALNIAEAENKRQADASQDIYETKEEAEEKAKQIGCVGSHTHEIDGKTYYMPCDNMKDYEDITGMKHKDEDDTTLVSYNSEQRQVDRTPPKFMQENAQRGLDNLNKAGDGLVDETIRQARIMSKGEQLSIDKIVKIAAWHKRHLSDLDREKTNPNDPNTWRASDVAFLLWGSNPWTNPMGAADWADRKIAQLVSEGKLEPRQKGSDSSTPAPKKDQVQGSKKNPKGSASGKKGGIDFSESTEKSIRGRIEKHNEDVEGMADWRKLKMGTAKAVVRRGFGAYSTSHRPGVSRQAWGLARLRAFSYLLKNDRPQNPKYRSDNDLLPTEHPRYSKKEEKMSTQHLDVFDRPVAISQTLETQKRNTILKEMDNQTENRSFTFSAVEERNSNDNDTLLFTGYASVFDKPYGVRDSRGQYNETIKQGAFKKTLKEQDDVRFLVNHDGIPLARTSSGTLQLEEDDYGLFVRAELDPSNPTVAEVSSAMKRGDLNEMSFAFAAIKDNFDNNGENREVNEARLFDVSVVTYPANPWAGAKLRGIDIENLHKELVEARSGEQATEILESFINQVADGDNVDKKRSNPKVDLLKMKLERDGIR